MEKGAPDGGVPESNPTQGAIESSQVEGAVTARDLVRQLEESIGDVPEQAEIFGVRQYAVEESVKRARRIIAAAGEVCSFAMERADWVTQADRTLARLPLGGRAVVHHASGAVDVLTGLAPLEMLFEKLEARETLISMVEETAEKLGVNDWVGRDQLKFERLWQIKAAAADRSRNVEPVLCRAVGAYRQIAGRLPVLGPASVSIKIAAGGALDRVSVLMRETAGEALEWAPVLAPHQAASQIASQLYGLMGNAKVPLERLEVKASMSFGYVTLGKRKAQRMLSPHYVAMIQIRAEEAQAYQFVVPATEKIYEAICLAGSHAAPALERRV